MVPALQLSLRVQINYSVSRRICLSIHLITKYTLANFSASVGCSLGSDIKDTMACLRKASVDQIILGINNATTDTFDPVFGDEFMPALPSQLFREGRFTPVEYMGGHCTNDGRSFNGGSPDDFHSDADITRLIFDKRWTGVVGLCMRIRH
jgi:carboxylesterase type B